MKLRIAVILVSLFSLTVGIAADKPADVRDLMSATQFHATGLDKLTPEEMSAFNVWLATYTHAVASSTGEIPAATLPAAPAPSMPAAVVAPTPAPSAASVNSFGKEMLSAETRGEPARVESNIVGHFTGWNGNTVFKLANGQVWKQADSSSFDTNLQDPPVVIKRLGFGYLLTLTGHGSTVFVKRVQ